MIFTFVIITRIIPNIYSIIRYTKYRHMHIGYTKCRHINRHRYYISIIVFLYVINIMIVVLFCTQNLLISIENVIDILVIFIFFTKLFILFRVLDTLYVCYLFVAIKNELKTQLRNFELIILFSSSLSVTSISTYQITLLL